MLAGMFGTAEIREMRERVLEEQPWRLAGAVEGLSVLASRLSHLTPALDNLIRIDEARNRRPRRDLEAEA